MNLLDQIETPEDIKSLSLDALVTLARELRETIVEVVSTTGGHLASSLGAVELALAIHYVFDLPKDKVVWDVGHQAYAHKLLTGRREVFKTLRQHGGISGFTRASESPYDAFTTGHSSTSISAGLGLACAKELNHDPGKVLAVIGDGSLTAGLAYEGLNQSGHIHKDFIVILNDNDMSIAKNVGALSSFLSRKFSAKPLQDMRREIGDFLKSLPRIGDDIYMLAKRSEESFKSFVTPGMLFEAFGFEYFGPIDGHNLKHLIKILANIKNMPEPVLLHVLTKKGKGYAPAEKNPVYFHGVGCFEKETGVCFKNAPNPTYTEVFGQTMVELAETNEKIVAVTAAMPEGTGLNKFSNTFPDRFYDVGIAEPHGVTFAAGLATEGLRPVVAIYSTFLQRAYDQILHDVCLENLPVVFAMDRGGLVGEDGPTHHGLFDLSYLRTLPNMTLMAPKDENELRRMLITAVSHPGPIALRYPRGMGLGVKIDPDHRPIKVGHAEIMAQGEDCLLLAIGSMVARAMEARKILLTQDITPAVVNLRFAKPLDEATLLPLIKRTPRVITLEENVLAGGVGSAVAECLQDTGIMGVRLRRIGIQDQFIEHGANNLLLSRYGLDAEGIAQTVSQFMTEVSP